MEEKGREPLREQMPLSGAERSSLGTFGLLALLSKDLSLR